MDDILRVINDNGRYQNYVKIMVVADGLLTPIYSVQISYMLKYPEFLVKNLSDTKAEYERLAYNEEFCDKTKYSIVQDKSHSLDNWAYNFSLYCENDFYGTFASSFIFLGGIVGTYVFSSLPDKYGRKPIFTLVMLLSCFVHLNMIYPLNKIHLLLINFFGGITNYGFPLAMIIIPEVFN